MNGSDNIKPNTIKRKINKLEKDTKTRALIFYHDKWYIYSNNNKSVEQLLKYNDDYDNFISYSREKCGFQLYHVMPTEEECSKYNNSHYLYSADRDCIYYYNHKENKTKRLNAIPKDFGGKNYNAKSLLKYLKLHYKDQETSQLPISIPELTLDDLVYITKLTGHTTRICRTLSTDQKKCVNNRIRNERVETIINWSAFGVGVGGFSGGAMIGWLVIAPIFALATVPAIFLSAITLATIFFVAAILLGPLLAWCMGKYKPINAIPFESEYDLIDDAPSESTSFMAKELGASNELGLIEDKLIVNIPDTMNPLNYTNNEIVISTNNISTSTVVTEVVTTTVTYGI